MKLSTLSLRVLGLLAATTSLQAQGALRGRVLSEATRAPVSGAEVMMPAVARRAFTDSSGNYILDDVPEGVLLVQVRKVGFSVVRDTAKITAGVVTMRDFLVSSQSSLDTVKTVAAQVYYISAPLRGFEERRARGESGHFIPEALLRKEDDKGLSSIVLQRIPGITILPSRAMGENVVSAKRVCAGRVLAPRDQCKPCFVTVYQDGQMIYRADERRSEDNPPPDFNRIQVNQLAGVEFYSSTGVAPPGYNASGSGCGTMLLWSRER